MVKPAVIVIVAFLLDVVQSICGNFALAKRC